MTTGYDFPLRTTLVVNSHFQNDTTLETEQGMAVTSQYDRHLHMDGLCRNTMENLSIGADEGEKIEKRDRRILSFSAVLMFIVCVVSLISLVLTLLMLTGNVSSRCSCASTKGKIKCYIN
jgi:hypothetical protein